MNTPEAAEVASWRWKMSYYIYLMIGREMCWPVLTREQMLPRDVPDDMLSIEVVEALTEDEALGQFPAFLDGCRFEPLAA